MCSYRLHFAIRHKVRAHQLFTPNNSRPTHHCRSLRSHAQRREMSSRLRISSLTLLDLRLTELDANFTAWRVKLQNATPNLEGQDGTDRSLFHEAFLEPIPQRRLDVAALLAE